MIASKRLGTVVVLDLLVLVFYGLLTLIPDAFMDSNGATESMGAWGEAASIALIGLPPLYCVLETAEVTWVLRTSRDGRKLVRD